MESLKHRIFAISLLLCFGLAIIPAETFHHHDFKSEICKESEIHFADHAVDCELASFLSPTFELPFEFQEYASLIDYRKLLIGETSKASSHFLISRRGRAPPVLV